MFAPKKVRAAETGAATQARMHTTLSLTGTERNTHAGRHTRGTIPGPRAGAAAKHNTSEDNQVILVMENKADRRGERQAGHGRRKATQAGARTAPHAQGMGPTRKS